MKEILFMFWGILMSVMLYGQGFAISADRMNIAYIGIENPLTIIAEGYSCSQVMVSCDNGVLKGIGDCKYLFSPEKQGISDIVVKVKTASGFKQIGIKKYRVKIMPDLTVAIAGKSSGRMATEIFKAQKGPTVVLEDFNYEYPAIVTEFKFEIIRNNQVLYSDKNRGPFFSEAIQGQIKDLKAGDKVLITDISVARPPNFCTRRRYTMQFFLY